VTSFVSIAFIAAVNDKLAKQMMKKLEELSSCLLSQNAEEIPPSVGPEISSTSS
jgi:hypothetical protein